MTLFDYFSLEPEFSWSGDLFASLVSASAVAGAVRLPPVLTEKLHGNRHETVKPIFASEISDDHFAGSMNVGKSADWMERSDGFSQPGQQAVISARYVGRRR